MIDIFEKSLIYLAEHPPGYPLPSQAKTNPQNKKAPCTAGRFLHTYIIQFQRLECSVTSLLPMRQKAPLRQKLHPPHILNEPLPL
ncbi:hypothetical protein BK761_23585 [Bacillus thuringiensis serovar darmstadiensis]|uniref:Uncharacterized protein n=1 Tax=Bacillus thuringiensis subsp. darmstadiensis TaxID=132264 RepID=A0A9X6G080_BACUD|nr:hypothetical protein BK761_23585 [Bacillus thuringiensis serovar darmstadiensis]